MRRSPRALIVWALAALVALGTARVVATDLASLHRRARELDAVADVVVARRDLRLGEVVAAGDLDTVRTAGALAGTSVTDAHDAIGRVVVVPVVAGAPLTSANLADASRGVTAAVVPRGMRAVHVRSEPGVRPTPGEIVDVLATFDPSLVVAGGGDTPTVVVARAATVLRSDADESVDDAAGAGITLLVTEDEAHRLAFASANGVLTIALAPPEDACCKPSSSASSRD